MIGDQHDGSRVIDGFDMLQAVNSHQVISRDMNPARAEKTLTPGPETFPATQIHAMSNAEGEALEGREDGEFFVRRHDCFWIFRHIEGAHVIRVIG